MEKEEKLKITLDGSLKAYTVTNQGVRKVANVKANEITSKKSDLDAKKLINLSNEQNKNLIIVDEKKEIEAGYYYKVEDVVDWLWDISINCNTEFEYKGKIILSKKQLLEKINPSIPASLMLETEEGHFVKQEVLNEIFNNLTGTPYILSMNVIGDDREGYISKFESEMVENGDLKLTATAIINKPKEIKVKVVNQQTENISKPQAPIENQVPKIENAPYENNNYYNGITEESKEIKDGIEKYINEDESDKKIIINPKRRKPTKEELIKFIKVIVIAIGAAMSIAVVNNMIKGFMEYEQPQPLPEPSPIATIDPSTLGENPEGEPITQEITDEDLYNYIDLGATYYIANNANLYRSGTDTQRAGTTTQGDSIVTSIIICESKKDINGNTVLENKQTISLNDGNLHETNLEKIYKEWLKNVEGNNFVIKVHLSRKNEVTNQEEPYGWVEVNKETFEDLAHNLEQGNTIKY